MIARSLYFTVVRFFGGRSRLIIPTFSQTMGHWPAEAAHPWRRSGETRMFPQGMAYKCTFYHCRTVMALQTAAKSPAVPGIS